MVLEDAIIIILLASSLDKPRVSNSLPIPCTLKEKVQPTQSSGSISDQGYQAGNIFVECGVFAEICC